MTMIADAQEQARKTEKAEKVAGTSVVRHEVMEVPLETVRKLGEVPRPGDVYKAADEREYRVIGSCLNGASTRWASDWDMDKFERRAKHGGRAYIVPMSGTRGDAYVIPLEDDTPLIHWWERAELTRMALIVQVWITAIILFAWVVSQGVFLHGHLFWQVAVAIQFLIVEVGLGLWLSLSVLSMKQWGA